MRFLSCLILVWCVARPIEARKTRSARPAPPPPEAVQPPPPPRLDLSSQGRIPEDFLGDPAGQVPTLAGRDGKALGFWASRSGSSEKRDWNEFWWRQLSTRRDLALRGWAMFGDPASVYLSQVLDSVLVSQPELRKKLRVYACPSPYVNAIMLPDGVALFNLGLLARLADESQLAQILAHEAAHFALHHAEDSWWEDREGSTGSSDRWARTRFQHSRERESMADSLGLVYLKGSRYSTRSVDSTFGILDASDNAQGTRPWSRDALSSFPDLTIPESTWLDPSRTTLAPPQTEDSDSMATHPAIPRRREASRRQVGADSTGGQTWLVGESRFLAVREAARLAVPHGWLEANQPAAALFESWNLLQTRPHDRALQSTFDQALIELALDRSAARRSAPRAARLRIWGAYQTLDHFIKHIDDARMVTLGILASRQAKARSPQDSLWAGLESELLSEWDIALPRHREYLQDTTRLARSLRRHQAFLDQVRILIPELTEAKSLHLETPDTGRTAWTGNAMLADIDWGNRPLARPFGGIDSGKALVRSALVSAFQEENVHLSAPSPVTLHQDSLATLDHMANLRDWTMDRLDARGGPRFRPRLPHLRKHLAPWHADKVLLVSLDYGPPEPSFDHILSPMRVAWFGNAGRAWYFPRPYLMGAVFDAKDGAVLNLARVAIPESPSAQALDKATRLLVKNLVSSENIRNAPSRFGR
ncbi:MAG: M48 family metalloprotease [Fibrobacteria bacterium]|nr:M48 family metalloprotease [Fibrobacteria bacterium]